MPAPRSTVGSLRLPGAAKLLFDLTQGSDSEIEDEEDEEGVDNDDSVSNICFTSNASVANHTQDNDEEEESEAESENEEESGGTVRFSTPTPSSYS